MNERSDIDALLTSPCSDAVAQQLIEWVTDLKGRILRGDMMIGILRVDEADKVPAALRKAAECGAESALVELARWFANPPIGNPDLHAAEDVLRAPIARNVDGALSLFVEIRYFLRRNDASPEERCETFDLLKAHVAASPHDARALYLLGLLTGQGFGTAPSPESAFQIHERAAALGNSDAMFELYAQLQSGIGVARDEAAAFEANKRAAEAGHARALYNMGTFYASGRHVPKDLAKAVEWYERASDAGNMRATATLAVMYATGEGVPKNLDLARELLDEADYGGFDTTAFREMSGL